MSVFKLIDTSKLTAIGDAIREKKRPKTPYPVDDMPDAIMSKATTPLILAYMWLFHLLTTA